MHGHSFTGNPVGCASAIASFDLLEKNECWKSIERITTSHLEFSKQLEGHCLIEEVRQMGTILAIELKADKTGYVSDIRNKLYDHFISEGVLLRPLGNVIYILPPYCITDEELSSVYNCVISGLETIAI